MYSSLYLARPFMGSCDVKSYAHCPTCFKLSQLAAFHQDGPEYSTPRRFHCCHIWEPMPDNVRNHLSFTFLLLSFLVEPSSNIFSIK
jgi:hypothetical protein